MPETNEDLSYPIGRFTFDPELTDDKRQEWIDQIARTPWNLRAAIAGFSDEQLETQYRPGGWTVRQVIHHLADSHLNSFVRFKLALTENNPTIKPYNEAAWAELPDGREAPIELSLKMLDVLHERWTILLQSFQPSDWQRTFTHPERGQVTLDQTLQLYAWHGNHHVAHITRLRARNGW
jgi:uncharacterized damage-inducible protein DinB